MPREMLYPMSTLDVILLFKYISAVNEYFLVSILKTETETWNLNKTEIDFLVVKLD